MLGKVEREELLFYITKEDVQNEAIEKLGRQLTDDELHIAQKGLDWGLTTDIDIIYKTIFDEMIKQKEL